MDEAKLNQLVQDLQQISTLVDTDVDQALMQCQKAQRALASLGKEYRAKCNDNFHDKTTGLLTEQPAFDFYWEDSGQHGPVLLMQLYFSRHEPVGWRLRMMGSQDRGAAWSEPFLNWLQTQPISKRWSTLVQEPVYLEKELGEDLTELGTELSLGLGFLDTYVIAKEQSKSATELLGKLTAQSHVAEQKLDSALLDAKNVIFYGPPGTGKTYLTSRRAVEIIDGKRAPESYQEVMKRYRELYDRDQIAFVTFHQSYGYEEFVEGIAPDLQSDEIRYKLRDGAFKRLALLALSEGIKKVDDFDSRWMTLAAKAGDSGFNVQSKERKDYILTFDGMRFALSGNTEYRSIARDKLRMLWDQFKNRDLKELTSKDFAQHVQNFTPFWTVLNAMKELPEADVRLFSEPGQLPLTELLELAKESLAQPEGLDFSNARRYVLIIDEINRGNISKILGELMTLLEPSKRLGGEQAMIVTLPSGEKFAVPPNLYVIGTMNTADRSIALMDVALRRRFRFEEMMPNVSVIVRSLLIHFEENYRDLSEENLLFVNLCVAVFEKVNQRIRFLYDADHQIGHSYFLKVKTLNELQFVFLNEVIPLLQEYFYGAWRKIALTLANPYDDKGLPRRKDLPAKHHVISCTKLEEKSVLLVDDEDYEDQYEFAVSNEFMRDYPKDDSDLLSFFAGVAGVRIEELKKLDERFKEIEVMLDSTSEVEVSGEENDEIQRTRLAMEVNGKAYEEPYVPRFFEAVLSDVFQHASPPLPYRRSSRHFISRDGLHPDGKAAIRPIPIQTPNGIVIVEGNYGRKDALRRLRELLTDMGISHRDPV